uniref:Uncharacterized protein n=1 Tax=Oryza punctata TaxID=4537 RepID=A0A0E0KP78_ORYPU
MARAAVSLSMPLHIELRLDLVRMGACMCVYMVLGCSPDLVHGLVKAGLQQRQKEWSGSGGKQQGDGDGLVRSSSCQEKVQQGLVMP